MLMRIYERAERASVSRLIIALLVCVALFRLRGWLLEPATIPDVAWRGYTPEDVGTFLSRLRPAARQLYAWTELTLDVVFPLIYAALLSRLIARTTPPGIGRYALWLPFVAAGADYVENGLLACMTWNSCALDSARFASIFTRGKWLVIALSLLIALPGSVRALYRARVPIGRHLPYVYLVRVPLLLALVLLGLPLAAMTGMRSVLGNLFVLTAGELFWVAVAIALSSATVLATARVVLLYGAERFGVASLGTPKTVPTWQVFVVVFIAGWMTAFALVASARGVPRDERLLPTAALLACGALGGGLIGGLLVWLIETARFLFADPPPAGPPGTRVSTLPDLVVPARLVPNRIHTQRVSVPQPGLAARLVTTLLGRERAIGYLDRNTGELLPGHLFALLVFVALLGLYALAFVLDAPRADRGSMIPALVYLLALLTLPTWALGAAAFFLDRYRIPVLVVPGALLALAFVWPTDHFFAMTPEVLRPSGAGGRALPSDLARRLDGCRLTAVAASGGGIRAAGWTAQVLTGLQRDLPAFAPSLKLVSAVSGGSVGTMYYVGAFPGPSGPPATALDPIVELAMRSSLNDVAWGLAYPDLWRTFTPVVTKRAMDRGRALEQAWGREWPYRDDTLRQWRDAVAAGQRPAVAFNATVVETGQRLAIATFDRPPSSSLQTWTFEDVYGSRDIAVVTAARLSATFTYVTPVARAREETAAKWHIADGGYQDNYGVATLVDWLAAALVDPRTMPVDASGRPCDDRLRIAIVRIGSHETDSEPKNRSWAFQVGAPIQVLLAIRTAGPRSRNAMELDMLRDTGLGRRVGWFCFDYDSDEQPLSWHLSPAQRRLIRDAWTTEDVQASRQKLREFFEGDGTREFSC
jgi:hypothetical protein